MRLARISLWVTLSILACIGVNGQDNASSRLINGTELRFDIFNESLVSGLNDTLSEFVEAVDALSSSPTSSPTKEDKPKKDKDKVEDTPEPTPIPTMAPSIMAPTVSPTSPVDPSVPIVNTQVLGQVSLKIINTPSLLIGDSEATFLTATRGFLRDKLINVDSNENGRIVQVQEVLLIRQFRQAPPTILNRRILQADTANTPLYVVLEVLAEQAFLEDSLSEFDFDDILADIFRTFSEEFVIALLAQDENSFFQDLLGVDVTTIEDDTTAPPTRSPVSEIGIPPSRPTFNANPSDSNNSPTILAEDSPFSIGVIVGIALGGAAIIVLVILISRHLIQQKSSGKKKSKGSTSSNPSSPNTGARTNDHPTKRIRTVRGYQNGLGSNDSSSLPHQPSDLESQGHYSQGLYSGPKDSDSIMSNSIMLQNSVAGMDNMSYAYSLEPGLEPSVMGAESSLGGDLSTISGPVPKEIPQITLRPQIKAISDQSFASSAPSYTSDFGIEASLNGAYRDESPSDLELTPSELAMLPSNLRGSADASSSQPTKEVIAPPGRLGIVIDTTVDGPVVHRVNDGSALTGKVFPGDIIVAIDTVDTRAMSASAITTLMVKTANQQRKLTIVEARHNQK